MSIFALIQLILKTLNLWDGLVALHEEQKEQALHKAVQESKTLKKSDDEIFKNQSDIVRNQPH